MKTTNSRDRSGQRTVVTLRRGGVRAEEGAIPLPKRAASPPRNPHYPNREALILPSHSGAVLYSCIRASP